MIKTWSLDDVSDRPKESKYTFYLPSKTVLKNLKIGDGVKLVFNCDVENDKGWSAERMWVRITKKSILGYEGFLDNDPYYIPDIKAGDNIRFKSKHIIQTSIEDPEPNNVDKYFQRCFVTDSVLTKGKTVTRLIREEPEEDEENYTGWTLYSEEDEIEYLNESSNWHYVAIGVVLNKGDQFIDLLGSEYGSEFLWNGESKKYEKI